MFVARSKCTCSNPFVFPLASFPSGILGLIDAHLAKTILIPLPPLEFHSLTYERTASMEMEGGVHLPSLLDFASKEAVSMGRHD